MSQIQSILIPDLTGGISDQPSHIRFPNQVEDAENIRFDIADGAGKRPGTRWVYQFYSSGPHEDSSLNLHPIRRDNSEQYMVVYGKDGGTGNIVLEVVDVVNAAEATVVIDSDAEVYLELNAAGADDLQLVTMADFTIIINKTVGAMTQITGDYTVTKVHKNVERLKAHTPADGTYHQATAEDSYWKYGVDGKTFATIRFPTVTGDQAKPEGIYDRSGESPHTFGIRFQKQDTALTNAAWTEATKTVTQTGKFSDYTFTPGDEIQIDGGVATTGWAEIASRVSDDAITLVTDINAAGGDVGSGVTGGEVRQNFSCERSNSGVALADMHEVAKSFQDAFGSQSEVLVSWEESGPQSGFFIITAPYRGSGATVLETYDLGLSGDTDLSAAGKPFDDTGATITAGTGTVTDANRTLDLDDRWAEQNPPGASDGGLDNRTMPVKMTRTLTSPLTFRVSLIDYDARASGTGVTNPSPKLFRRAVDEGLEGSITGITLASPAVVTSTAHGLVTGDKIHIIGTDSTPILDGERTVTRINDDTFSVGVNTSGTGSVGTWAKGSAKITDASFHENRLFMCGGEFVAASQAGDLFDFFAEDATVASDADPLDLRVSGDEVSVLSHIEPFRQTLVLDSKNGRQFELSSDNVLTPTSVRIDASTNVRTTGIGPARMGAFVFLVSERGNHTTLHEYAYREEIVTTTTTEITRHYVSLPTGLTRLVSDSESLTAVLAKRATDKLYVYRPYWIDANKVQSAWSVWDFPGTYNIQDIAMLDGSLYMLVETGNKFALERLPMSPEGADTGYDYEVFGDRQIAVTGVYLGADSGSITNITVANPTVVSSASHGLNTGDQIDITGSNSTPSIDGRQTVTVTGPGTFTVPVNVTSSGNAGSWAQPDTTAFDMSAFKAEDSTINRYVKATAWGATSGDVVNPTDTGAWDYSTPSGGTVIEIPGNHSTAEVILFHEMDASLTLSRPYRRSEGGHAIIGDRLHQKRLTISHANAGVYTVTITSSGSSNRTKTFTPTGDTDATGHLDVLVSDNADRIASIVLSTSSAAGVMWTGIEHIVEARPGGRF